MRVRGLFYADSARAAPERATPRITPPRVYPTHAPRAADNWVWSPQGSIAMHLPEKWGMLQFADGPVNATPAVWNREWPVRSIAAAVYYAQHAYAGAHNGSFTDKAADLLPFLADGAIVDGTCTAGAPVLLAGAPPGAPAAFSAAVPGSPAGDPAITATINNLRVLQVGRAR